MGHPEAVSDGHPPGVGPTGGPIIILMKDAPVRVLIAKPGLDGHDRGAKVVIRALRDAGMEVIYTGRHQKVSSIVRTAIDEDVEVVGLSVLSGAHEEYARRVAETLAEGGKDEVVLVIGGTISEESRPILTEMGYLVYPTGSSLGEIVGGIETAVLARRAPTSSST